MDKMQTIRLLAGAALLGIGCGVHLQLPRLAIETQNRIALCTGGYSTSASRAMAAEFSRRMGKIITEAETEEKGVDTFAFGEQRGQAAVDMYNTYVRCISMTEGEASRAPLNNSQTLRWKDHEIGVTRSGEPVVQTPMPGEESTGKEIQLQIVTAKEGPWSSKGTPRWEGWCNGGELRQIGNETSYTYRFFVTGQGQCQIILHAMADDGWYLWSETYHIQVGK